MKTNYRPDIDGLRAIAVVSVILYHTQITIFGHQPFKGGFIGVDIFFVISGYLITSIILKELCLTKRISFKYFYQRRIRRILPLLLFVILSTLPFAWYYLLPDNLVNFSKSILYSISFSSNLFFHFSGQEYAAESGLLKPFLHTWSLSIEEQFYIFFPIILLFSFKYFRKYLVYILSIGFMISLGLADVTSRNYPSSSFYLIQTRVWELLAGSIIAYIELFKVIKRERYFYNIYLPKIGFFIIFLYVIFFKEHFNHPSLYTLISIFGVCIIILFPYKGEIINKILSSKLFVSTGLISYSLYLWHYPILAFFRINDFEKNFSNLSIVFVILIILSCSSYYLIEKPFRNKKLKFRFVLYFIIFILSVILTFTSFVIIKDGYPKRYFEDDIKLKELSLYGYKDSIFFETNYNYDNYDKKKNILVVGNSHAEDLIKIFSKTQLSKNYYFNLTSPRVRTKDLNYQLRYFYEFLKNKKAIIDPKIDEIDFLDHLQKQYDNSNLIIIATRYNMNDLDILDQLIKLIKNDEKKIIIFNSALIQKNKEEIEINRLLNFVVKNKRFPNLNEISMIENQMFLDLKFVNQINAKIAKIAKINNIPLIEREKVFCIPIETRCPSITKNFHNIYWDSSHITDKGAEFFANILEKNPKIVDFLNTTQNSK